MVIDDVLVTGFGDCDCDDDDDDDDVPNVPTACVPLLPSALQRHNKVAVTTMLMMMSMVRNAAALWWYDG